MENATGQVSSVNGDVATVIVAAPVACRRCASGKGCGAGLLLREERRRLIDVPVPAGMCLKPGDRVSLVASPRQLLRATLLAYGLPLLSMLAFVAFAGILLADRGELTAVLFAVLGLGAGLVTGRSILSQEAACKQFVPVIEAHPGDAVQ